MALIRIAAISILIASLFGCASVKYEALAELPQVEAGKGLVVFYRESSLGGSALTYQVHEGEELIGVLRSGTYFYNHSEPGNHTYWGQTVVRNSVTLDVVAGQTHFIKGDVTMGYRVGHPRLTVVQPARGEAAIAKLRYAVPGN